MKRNKYIYQVVPHHNFGDMFFSSWLKAFKYCNDQGATYRAYEDNYITQMTDNARLTFDIRKHIIS